MSHYLGIDPSLNGTSVCLIDGNGEVVKHWGFTTRKGLAKLPCMELIIPPKTETGRIERIVSVAKHVEGFAITGKMRSLYSTRGIELYAGIESYALSQRSQRYSDLCELGGLIKSKLWHRAVPFQIYTPQQIKSAATGKSTASKEEMIEACEAQGVSLAEYGKEANNFADSYWIAQLVRADHLLKEGKEIPEFARIELEKTTKRREVAIVKREFIRRF